MRFDVAVVGAGPAGSAAVAALSRRGLSVVHVAPDHERPWAATYGAWVDELDHLPVSYGLAPVAVIKHSWPSVMVVGREVHHLDRPYALLDAAALRDGLRSTATGAGALRVDGAVAGANHDRWRSTLVLGDGRVVDARLIIDASGGEPVLVERPERPMPAWQVAHGLVARCSAPPIPPGSAVLMDWSWPSGAPQPSAATFLYGFDLGDGTWFVEETSLARRPALSPVEAESALRSRLVAQGVEVVEVIAEERVRIPMGGALAYRTQREVGFGAAAGMIHPATGYSVAASLRVAPGLAAELADAIQVRRTTPASLSELAWSAVWPSARRRTNALQRYGLDVVARLDRSELQCFFDAFFNQPAELWSGYLSGELAPAGVASLMGAVFASVPVGLRSKLASGNPLPALRDLR